MKVKESKTFSLSLLWQRYTMRNIASNLHMAVNKAKKEKELDEIFLGKIDHNFVTVEEFIPGTFVEYLNNTGERCVEAEDEEVRKQSAFLTFLLKNQIKIRWLWISKVADATYTILKLPRPICWITEKLCFVQEICRTRQLKSSPWITSAINIAN